MTRRSPGEGSVHRSPDGSGWVAMLELGAAPGGRRQRKKRRARTKTEAHRLLREMQAELDQRGELGDGHRTVAAAVRDYLLVRQGEKLQPRTQEKDARSAAIIEQGLGTRRLSSLSVDDCDHFLDAVARGEFGRPMAQPQLRRHRQKLIRVVENDQRRGLVNRNVAAFSVVPQESPHLAPRRKPRALTQADLGLLLSDAEGVLKVLVDLSGRNGMRPAEVRGLRWSRVNLSEMVVKVDGQLNRRNEVVAPKTKRSPRTVRIDAQSVSILDAWRSEQGAQARRAGPAWQGNVDDLVATTLVGTAFNQRNVHRSLVKACDRSGIKPAISAYDLRHSAITLQVENGHPVHKIADWAGTSERMIADVYRHKLDDVSDIGPAISAAGPSGRRR